MDNDALVPSWIHDRDDQGEAGLGCASCTLLTFPFLYVTSLYEDLLLLPLHHLVLRLTLELRAPLGAVDQGSW